jgi:hypothetical protein
MKQGLLFILTILSVNAFAQAFESFNFTGVVTATNGWVKHSGTLNQLQVDSIGSLNYPGLESSVGNKVNFVAGDSEDVNKPVNLSTDSAFYSLLIRVPSTTGLQLNSNTTGDNFFGFGATAGTNVTVFGSQLRIRAGVAANTFQIALLNSGAGSVAPTMFSADLSIDSTYFLVVRMNKATSPTESTLWINPTPGSLVSPVASIISTQSTSAFSSFASIYLRQAGTATAGTGNIQLDEIRVGSTWQSVTPAAVASCITYNTFFDTTCTSYVLNNETYTVSGTYVQTLTNANAAGCDSVITLYLTFSNPATYYLDMDNDGFGDPAQDSLSCGIPIGYVTNNTDCDDSDALLNQNTVWYQDLDNDQVGNSNVSLVACLQPVGYVLANGDCDDNDPNLTVQTMYYIDLDQDGYGNDSTGALFCQIPVNLVPIGGDCDDANNAIYPGAPEICDGYDNNCNGQNDEGLTFLNYYYDGDNDGYGIGAITVSCVPLAGYATLTGDCDDSDNTVNPGATDTEGNNIDENCDGVDGVAGLATLEVQASIAPNPTNGLLEVRFNQEVVCQIRLTDLNGKVLQVVNVSGLAHALDLSALQQGTYLIQINSSTQRIVKL